MNKEAAPFGVVFLLRKEDVMRYVMSDIHGRFDKFQKMLETINFNENDELFILGDIFDRGDNPCELLEFCMINKNVHLLQGNHEQMFIDFIESEFRDTSWLSNGGMRTFNALTLKGEKYLEQAYIYLKKLPFIKVVDKFILVHAGIFYMNDIETVEDLIAMQERDTCLWDRSNIGLEKQFKDYTVICGHTPVQCIEQGRDTILKRDGVIYIDCGAPFPDGQLGCLNIDTMEEYYV